MATTIWPKGTRTFARAPTGWAGTRDILTTNAVAGSPPRIYTDTDVEKQLAIAGDPTTPLTWYSPRVETTVSVSGQIEIHVYTTIPVGGVTARLRVRLSKLSAGGSDIETVIADPPVSSNLTSGSSALTTFIFTPSSSVTMAAGERFVYRAWIQPVDGTYSVSTTYVEHTITHVSFISKLVFTETITFVDNGYAGIMRDTKVTEIGNFRDLAEARGADAADSIFVPSAAGGGELVFSLGALLATSIDAAAIASTSNASTYASASFTPVANRLYLLGVVHSDAAPETTVPTVATTTGLTWVQVGSSMPFSTIASPGLRLTLFRALKASGLSAGTYTVTLGDSGTGCATRLIEVSGVVTTGTDGADAVLNVSTNSNNASADPSVTLGAFNDTDNGTILFVGNNIATVPTGGTGMAMLGHSTYSTPTGSVAAAWNSDNDTTPDLVLASSAWAAIAVELVEGAIETAEWISPRFASPGWTLDTQQMVTPLLWFFGDATAVTGDNMGAAAKLFRRRPDGTELLAATWTTTTGVPAAGLKIPTNATCVVHQPTNFAEDDRLVTRPYRTPVGGSMAGGHVLELLYDGPSAGIQGDCYMKILDPPRMKAEGDPDADPTVLPSRLPLMGA